jgi:hypothetical protein
MGGTPVSDSKSMRKPYPTSYIALGYVVFFLLAAGVIGTIAWPSRIAQLAVPIGFTLWALLAYLLRRYDRPSAAAPAQGA